MSVLDNYRYVLENIADTALKCGRNPQDITLVAVTKGYSWDHIKPVYAAGCREFGENRIQEALPKIAEYPEDIQWHFIGNLQKNKANKAVESFVMIHAVDSYELAEKISECSIDEETETKIMLEVNVSGEETKHGIDPDNLNKELDKILELPSIKVEGLMTMAPFVEDPYPIRKCFARLWNLRDEIVMKSLGKIQLPHLSMGMSNDYVYAIQEGATILRIGTAIFHV